MSKECSRSHPHENMDCCCEHKTDIARLTNKSVHLNAENERLANAVAHYKNDQVVSRDLCDRLQAHNAMLLEALEGIYQAYNGYSEHHINVPSVFVETGIAASEVINATYSDIQQWMDKHDAVAAQKIAELEKKLAEQQVKLDKAWLIADCEDASEDVLEKICQAVSNEPREFAKLLAAEREVGRNEVLMGLSQQEPVWWWHVDEIGTDRFMSLSFDLPDEIPLIIRPQLPKEV